MRVFKITLTVLLVSGMIMSSFSMVGAAIIKRQLPNGMTVLIKEDHKLPVVAIHTWVKTGYFNEPDSLTGISHLLEHMFFKGTPTRGVGQVAKETKVAGGYLNGATSYTHTSYYTLLPSESFQKGLDIQSDVLWRSVVDSAELAKESKVIIQEIKRKLDNPTSYSYEKLLGLAFDSHWIRRWRMGSESRVASWTGETVRNYYLQAYRPENIILAVVGDIDTTAALQLVEKYYAGQANQKGLEAVSPSEPSQTKFKYGRMTADINRDIIYLGFHVPGVLSDDYYPLLVMDNIMSAGRSSRLYEEIKENLGLADVVNSSYDAYKDFGFFTVYGQQGDGDPRKLMTALLEQVERFKLSNVSSAELTKSINQLEAGYLHGLENVNDQAENLAYYESMGDYRLADTYLNKLRAVTAEDIRRVAGLYFNLSNATAFEYLSNQGEFPTYSAEELGQQLGQNLGEYRKSPHPPKDDIAMIVASPTVGGKDIADQPAQKEVLENGITLICKENHSLPIVSVAAYFIGGTYMETPDNYGATQLLVRTSLKGCASSNAANIAGDIESMGGAISYEVSDDYFGYHYESMSKNLEEGLSIFSQVIINPTFPASEFQKEKKDLLAEIRRLKDSTEDYPIELSQRALFQNTIYGAPTLGDSAVIEQLQVSDIANRHRRAITTGNFVLVFAGDITSGQAKALTIKYFHNMNQGKRSLLPSIPAKPLSIVTKIEKRDKAQSAQAISFASAPCSSKDYEPLKLCQNILSGMGGILWTEIRDKRSLAYTVYAYQEAKALSGVFTCYMATSPVNAKEARLMAIKAISGLNTEKISAEEFQAAQNYTIGGFLISLQSNSALADVLARWELMGRGYDAVMAYPQRIREVTVGQVRAAATKYLAGKSYGLGMIEGGNAVLGK
jgi:zinc protease